MYLLTSLCLFIHIRYFCIHVINSSFELRLHQLKVPDGILTPECSEYPTRLFKQGLGFSACFGDFGLRNYKGFGVRNVGVNNRVLEV